MAIITIGFIADTHNSNRADNDGGNGRYYSQVPAKTQDAVDQFVSTGVDYIVHLGDAIDVPADGAGSPSKMDDLVAILNENADSIPVLWCIGNHDCYNVAYGKLDWLVDTGQASTYKYVDEGNLRLFALDTCFSRSATAYPTSYDYTIAYISTVQIVQLEIDLQAADDAGKFSILCMHHAIGEHGAIWDIRNYNNLLALVKRHKVIAVFTGHSHKNRHRLSIDEDIIQNADGQDVHIVSVDGIVDGVWNPPGDENNAYVEAIFDDAAGTLTSITGYYNAWGMKRTTWNGTADGDAWTTAGKWTNGIPANGDIVTFDATSIKNPAGIDQTAVTITKWAIENGYTGGIGNGAYMRINGDVLTIDGGFKTSRLGGTWRHISASGGAGADKLIRFGSTMIIGDGSVPGVLKMDMTDSTWEFIFFGGGGRMDAIHYLKTGKLKFQTGNSYGHLIQTGGAFTFAGGKVKDVHAQGGTFTATVATAMTIDKLLIKGATIDLSGDNITITNGIELYKTPMAYTNKTDQIFEVTVKGSEICELEQIMTADNFVTKGNVARQQRVLSYV